MTSYFRRRGDDRFVATENVQGAWNTAEQHIAPVLGLLAHVTITDHQARGGAMVLGRVGYDILGVLTIDDEMQTEVRVLRPGRTIELIEATLSQNGRTAVIARAWMLAPTDTAAVAGIGVPGIRTPDEMPSADLGDVWQGKFLATLQGRRDAIEPGHAQFWLRPTLPLLEGEPISATARFLSVADVANGLAVRANPEEVFFPNLELTAHLTRVPEGEWTGFDTYVTFDADGVGLTQSTLYDARGPIGAQGQTLTVRVR